jgi:2-polyprenyl-6-hydroxyphenyl methylase/3-demethylubiquinone-9 3-methyltransferase
LVLTPPPPPSGALSPLLWGAEDHVRELFGSKVEALNMSRREYFETAKNSREYFELFTHTFGPMVAIHASLRDQPARAAELDEAFLQFIARWNQGAPEGHVHIPYDYLLVVARRW